jgi:hypothetical protein
MELGGQQSVDWLLSGEALQLVQRRFGRTYSHPDVSYQRKERLLRAIHRTRQTSDEAQSTSPRTTAAVLNLGGFWTRVSGGKGRTLLKSLPSRLLLPGADLSRIKTTSKPAIYDAASLLQLMSAPDPTVERVAAFGCDDEATGVFPAPPSWSSAIEFVHVQQSGSSPFAHCPALFVKLLRMLFPRVRRVCIGYATASSFSSVVALSHAALLNPVTHMSLHAQLGVPFSGVSVAPKHEVCLKAPDDSLLAMSALRCLVLERFTDVSADSLRLLLKLPQLSHLQLRRCQMEAQSGESQNLEIIGHDRLSVLELDVAKLQGVTVRDLPRLWKIVLNYRVKDTFVTHLDLGNLPMLTRLRWHLSSHIGYLGLDEAVSARLEEVEIDAACAVHKRNRHQCLLFVFGPDSGLHGCRSLVLRGTEVWCPPPPPSSGHGQRVSIGQRVEYLEGDGKAWVESSMRWGSGTGLGLETVVVDHFIISPASFAFLKAAAADKCRRIHMVAGTALSASTDHSFRRWWQVPVKGGCEFDERVPVLRSDPDDGALHLFADEEHSTQLTRLTLDGALTPCEIDDTTTFLPRPQGAFQSTRSAQLQRTCPSADLFVDLTAVGASLKRLTLAGTSILTRVVRERGLAVKLPALERLVIGRFPISHFDVTDSWQKTLAHSPFEGVTDRFEFWFRVLERWSMPSLETLDLVGLGELGRRNPPLVDTVADFAKEHTPRLRVVRTAETTFRRVDALSSWTSHPV